MFVRSDKEENSGSRAEMQSRHLDRQTEIERERGGGGGEKNREKPQSR
jgi:hypothetical protein